MSADNAVQAQSAAQTYDVGRVSARRFAGLRISGDLILRVAMVIFLGVSLYAQLDHTAYVVEHLARKSASGAHAYALAIAVEFSVLLFVLAGHRRISWAFAAATFLTNLSFYWIQLDGQWRSAEGAMAVLMALLLPGVIIGYSHSAVGHGAAQDNAQDGGTDGDVAQNGAEAHNTAHEGASAAHDSAGAQQDVLPVVVVAQSTAQDGAERHVSAAQAQQDAQDNAQDTQDAAQDGAKMTKEQRRMHIKESGVLDAAQVAAQYRVSMRTAQDDIKAVREAMAQTNGHAAHAAQGW